MQTEKAQDAETLRPKVGRLFDGTDEVVRAMNAGNSAGAKDLDQFSDMKIQPETGGDQNEHKDI